MNTYTPQGACHAAGAPDEAPPLRSADTPRQATADLGAPLRHLAGGGMMASDAAQAHLAYKTLTLESPLLLMPSVAEAVGVTEALLLQQIHYWTQRSTAKADEAGYIWIYNSAEDWRKQFPFCCKETLMRALRRLAGLGVLRSRRRHSGQWKRENEYALDYAAFRSLLVAKGCSQSLLPVVTDQPSQSLQSVVTDQPSQSLQSVVTPSDNRKSPLETTNCSDSGRQSVATNKDLYKTTRETTEKREEQPAALAPPTQPIAATAPADTPPLSDDFDPILDGSGDPNSVASLPPLTPKEESRVRFARSFLRGLKGYSAIEDPGNEECPGDGRWCLSLVEKLEGMTVEDLPAALRECYREWQASAGHGAVTTPAFRAFAESSLKASFESRKTRAAQEAARLKERAEREAAQQPLTPEQARQAVPHDHRGYRAWAKLLELRDFVPTPAHATRFLALCDQEEYAGKDLLECAKQLQAKWLEVGCRYRKDAVTGFERFLPTAPEAPVAVPTRMRTIEDDPFLKDHLDRHTARFRNIYTQEPDIELTPERREAAQRLLERRGLAPPSALIPGGGGAA